MGTLTTAEAANLINSLRVGDRVIVGMDGREHDMIVSRGPRLSDGAFGSWESVRVTVTFGPGRYSREIIADGVSAGYVTIRRAPTEAAAFGAAVNAGEVANVQAAQAAARAARAASAPARQAELFGRHGEQQPDLFGEA